jgi:tetratricopeptide (TPR) repeat protein
MSSTQALARRAVALDGADAEARSLLSGILWHRGDYEGALAEVEKALATAPNLALAHWELAATLIFSGSPNAGLTALQRSIRLDPHGPQSEVRLNVMALGFYLSREYVAAVETAKQAIRSYPDFANTLPLARCRPRSAWSDRRGKGGTGKGDRAIAGVVGEKCPQSRALGAARRPRSHARRSAKGRMGGLSKRVPLAPDHSSMSDGTARLFPLTLPASGRRQGGRAQSSQHSAPSANISGLNRTRQISTRVASSSAMHSRARWATSASEEREM